MNVHKYIDANWGELRKAINAAYKAAANYDDPKSNLKDYAEDISWHDDLAALVGRESANERQHRGSRSVRGFSTQDAAKLILMQGVADGLKMQQTPDPFSYLVVRHTAFEARVIGFLLKGFLDDAWIAAVNALDYAELMRKAS